MKTTDFEYELPEDRIAQSPHIPRDECKLLVLDGKTNTIEDKIFKDILEYIRPNDLLIANETRVLPSRLLGNKRTSGGAAEIFLLKELPDHPGSSDRISFWTALVKPGKRLKPGSGAIVDFKVDNGEVILSAEIVDFAKHGAKGERIVKLTSDVMDIDEALHAVGNTPLPPYITNYVGDKELYQTVYSKDETSAAAPTAGLHFTEELIKACKQKSAKWMCVELQVGLDTFRVVDEENAEDHAMHTETYTVSQEVVDAINECKKCGGRVIAVGTTSVRSLESAASSGELQAKDHEATSLFILPGYDFKVVDAIITNFHIPRSTLMMLVSAFAGRENIMEAYQHALDEEYRFLSFGDAMLLL